LFYVEHVERGRWSPAEVEKILRNTASQDGLNVIVRLPQDPGAAGKSDAASKVRLLAGYPVRVMTVSGEKTLRAKPASAQAEAGNIKLVRGDWNEAFLDEISGFPSMAHDDQVDALADALNELTIGANVAQVGSYTMG
jgi:predicted phage terminase large subunit-like protein